MDGSHLSVHEAASGIPSAGHLGVPSVGQVGYLQNSRPLANGGRDDDECDVSYPAQSAGQLPTVSAIPSTSVHTVPFNLPNLPNASSAQYGGHSHTLAGRLNRPNEPFSMIFRKKYERLDWRKIASIDLEKIYKTQDTRALQDNLTQMAFFDLEEELRCVGINPQFEKLFQTMQLSLEYLLYVQDHLQREIDSIKGASAILIKRQTDTIKKFEHEVEDLKAQLQSSKDELKKRKKMMVAQQEIINSAAKGNYHRCPMCEKAFIERGYLETHFRKRHPNADIKMLGSSRDQQFLHDHQSSQTHELQQSAHAVQPCPVCPDVCTPELAAARDRIRELEKMLFTPPKPAVPEPPPMPPQVLDMYNKQREEIEHLRSSLAEFQNRYFESDKALVELRKDYQHLTDKVHEAQASMTNQQQQNFQHQMQQMQNQERPQSPNPAIADMIERRVNGIQESMERRLAQSEESWKDKFARLNEQHTRDLKDLERDMALKAQELQTAHKAEKLRLQMQNEEQERRIREMENQYNNQRAQPQPSRREPGSGAFQIQVHTNRPSTAGPTNRWGKPMTPRVSAAMNNYPEIIEELRDELNEALSKKLEEYGVPRGATKVSDRDKDEIFNKLRREHTQLQGKLAKFGAARSTIENHLKGKAPAQYSSSELLDEASKIRVRKRSGRQVVESGSNQKVTEITTYDIRPARSSELDLARQQAVPAEGGEREASSNVRRVSFRAAKDKSPASSPRSARAEPPDQGSGPPQHAGRFSQPNSDLDLSAPKKKNDGAWFSDEDSQ